MVHVGSVIFLFSKCQSFINANLGSLDAQRRAHTTHTRIAMSSNATSGVETPSCKRKREIRDAGAANAGEAIPGLLNDIVITHVLRSEHFDDPADLARLPAVPCGESRDARRGGGDGAAV